MDDNTQSRDTRNVDSEWKSIREPEILEVLGNIAGDDYESVTRNLKGMNRYQKSVAINLAFFTAFIGNSSLNTGMIDTESVTSIDWINPKIFLRASNPLLLVMANNTALSLLGHVLIKFRYSDKASYAWNRKYGSASIWEEDFQESPYNVDTEFKKKFSRKHSWDTNKARALFEAAIGTHQWSDVGY